MPAWFSAARRGPVVDQPSLGGTFDSWPRGEWEILPVVDGGTGWPLTPRVLETAAPPRARA